MVKDQQRIRLTPLKDLLAIFRFKNHPKVQLGLLQRCWNIVAPEVLGNKFSNEITIVSCKQHELLLHVSSSVWAQEITLYSGILTEKMNAMLGENLIEAIRTKVGT
jgi:hypothetical protein